MTTSLTSPVTTTGTPVGTPVPAPAPARVTTQRPQTPYNRLLPFRHGLSRLALCGEHDEISYRVLSRYGEYCEAEVDVFRAFVEPDFVVANIGANIGLHTLALADLTRESGTVWAFEPQPLIYQTLCANVALNSCTHVHPRPWALGSYSGVVYVPTLDPTVDQNTGSVSLVALLACDNLPGTPTRLERVDNFELSRLDFLLIDAEAMEPDVLAGAADTIDRCKPVVYLEANWNRDTILDFFAAHDYTTYIHVPLMARVPNYLKRERVELEDSVGCPMILAVPGDDPIPPRLVREFDFEPVSYEPVPGPKGQSHE